MGRIALSLAAGTALLVGGTAHAQTFVYEVTWEPVESIGGLTTGPGGRRYGGGVVEGTYTTTNEDGSTVTGTVKCVGMDQPDGGVFAIHLTCDYSDQSGGGSIVYGCNFQGEPGPNTPLGCIGGFEAKSGEFSGRAGNLTMDWYSASQSSGTGQWYRSGG